ncbi:MAG: creatininase family protein, partial [Dermabacteraceae bacterium]
MPDTAAQQPVRLAHLDAHRFRDWMARGGSTVIVPAGAFEQHGPHLPMGTDALLSATIAEAVAARMGAKVAEPFSYGYKSQQKSGGGDHLPGTISLDAAALIAQARCVIAGFLSQGVANVVVLNGHFENYQFLYEAADLALGDLRADGIGGGGGSAPSVLLLSYWDYVSEGTLAEVYPDGFPGWDI